MQLNTKYEKNTLLAMVENGHREAFTQHYTPRLILSHDSLVWFTTVSSIIYPAVFVEKERKVEISGEACFDVAPYNKKNKLIINEKEKLLRSYLTIKDYNEEDIINTTKSQK